MKVIFLDIDGVMNSHIFYEERHKCRWLRVSTYRYHLWSKLKWLFNGGKYKTVSLSEYKPNPKHNTFDYLFGRLRHETDPVKWKWLSELCNENDYKICISSVWKNHFRNINYWHKAFKLLGFNDSIFVGITGNRKTERGTEIQEWLEISKVDRYIILDDDSDMLPEQMKSFILIDGYFGLSPNTIYRIKQHFEK